MINKQISVLILLFNLALNVFGNDNPKSEVLYKEKYRPQFHFSPKQGWIGDPCGFIYYQNKYHMYWWGKVISDDLVHYREVSPFVMKGDKGNIAYFTGSVLIDKKNTASFGENSFIASYTIFNKETKNQSQGMSYSNDGETFKYYEGNPVLDIGSTEFRDPTIFWHEETSRWIMVITLALEKKVKFYSSNNLKNWTWMSDFGPAGDSERSWECPDMFQLCVDGDPNNKKWVMVLSVNWAKQQYFIGDFDGTSFKLIGGHPTQALYLDNGLDFYAARTFQDYDGTLKDKVMMGWVATWDYAPLVPTSWGKGFWSIPRNLKLRTYPEGIRLAQEPIEKLKELRYKSYSYENKIKQGVENLPNLRLSENIYEMKVSINTDQPNLCGLNLCVGDGRKVVFSYDTESHTLLIDRTNCADTEIEKFARVTYATIKPINNKIELHFFVDKSSIELFANDGKEVFTLLTYPSEQQAGIQIFALNRGTNIRCEIWNLKSIWDQ